MKRVAIVGAGPAGLFSALRLAQDGFQVTVFDKGKDITQRKRSDGFDLLHGLGGSGTFSDGKLNFHPEIGGNLHDFLPPDQAQNLIQEVEQVFREFGVPLITTEDAKTHELERQAATAGMRFLPIRQGHIGSDHLVSLIKDFGNHLRDWGVTFQFETPVEGIVCDNDTLQGLEVAGEIVPADFAILAPGRVGSEWVKQLCTRHGLKIRYNPVDIGVRIEVPSIVMEQIIGVCYDPKFYIRTPTYDDRVRTFCVSPGGFVVQETYEEGLSVGVNGHALRDRSSPNTNFALLVSINLTEPVESTADYGLAIARLTTTIGGGRPILQSLGDLRRHRRSTWGRLRKSPGDTEPTLVDVTPGDVSMALPHRIVTDLLEALEMLARVIPGLNSDPTLVYGAELKLYANRVETNRRLQTRLRNLSVAGDGAGVARGIVGAAATGILAARGIIETAG